MHRFAAPCSLPRAAQVRLVALLAVLGLVGACGEPVATAQPVLLEAAGSASMAPLLAELAVAFEAQAPGVRIEVAGPGTGFGLQALEEGEVDLALASWLPGGTPPVAGWQATAIARDGLAVVVHPDNPVQGIGLLQLQDLFDGRIYDWTALGLVGEEVLPVSREEGSGSRAAFEALVMEDRRVTPRALLAPSPGAVRAAVAANPGAIGYLALGDVTPEVKVLRVEGELPTPETAAAGSYALTRELWLVVADPPPEAVQQFLAFVLSPSGQEIVGRRYGRVR